MPLKEVKVVRYLQEVGCNLASTLKLFLQGMIKNFKYLIDLYGHIPNGNRWYHCGQLNRISSAACLRLYYVRRSQPPVFPLMVMDFVNSTQDPTTERQFIASIIWSVSYQRLSFYWQGRGRSESIDRFHSTHQPTHNAPYRYRSAQNDNWVQVRSLW